MGESLVFVELTHSLIPFLHRSCLPTLLSNKCTYRINAHGIFKTKSLIISSFFFSQQLSQGIRKVQILYGGQWFSICGEVTQNTFQLNDILKWKDWEFTAKFLHHFNLFYYVFLPTPVVFLLTQADLLPRVGRKQENQQGHGREEHTRDEEIEGVIQGPPP